MFHGKCGSVGSTDMNNNSVEIIRILDPFEGGLSSSKTDSGQTLKDIFIAECDTEMEVTISVNGFKVEEDLWESYTVDDGDQVFINEKILDSDDLRIAAMIGLVLISGPAAGALATSTIGGWGFAAGLSTTIATTLTQIGIVVGGGYLVNSLGPKPSFEGSDVTQDSQAVGWNPRTKQKSNAPISEYFGRNELHGNVISDYIEVSGDNGEEETLKLLLSLGAGPVEGIESDSIRINGQRIDSNFSDIQIEEFKGTTTQDQSTLVPYTKSNYRPYRLVSNSTPITVTTPDDDFDELEIVVEFPKGVYFVSDSNGWSRHGISYKLEISPKDAETWSTIVEDTENGSSATIRRLKFSTTETYTGGDAISITRGTSYDVKLTKTSVDKTSTSYGDDLVLAAIQEVFEDEFSYPGMSYIAISAIATKEISGSLDVSVIQKGHLVNVYDGSAWSIEYSYNPAWILWYIFTSPVIAGDGGSTPFTIDHYRGIDPSKLDLESFYNYAQFCDTLVPIGDGEYEKRFELSRGFDLSSTIWSTALKICSLTRAIPVPRGSKIKIVVDEEKTTPRQVFTASNTSLHSFERRILSSLEKITELEITYIDEDKGFEKITNTVIDSEHVGGSEFNKGSLELIGLRTETRAWRQARFNLLKNRTQNFLVKIKTDVESIGCEIGDLIKVQSSVPIWGENIVVKSSTSTSVTIHGSVTASGSDSVVVRSVNISGSSDYINEKTVTSVTTDAIGDTVINISGAWGVNPSSDDIGFFGPVSKVSRDFQVFDIQRTNEVDAVIWAIEYSSVPHTIDTETPVRSYSDYTFPDTVRSAKNPLSESDLKKSYPTEILMTNMNFDRIDLSGFTFAGDDPLAGSVSWTTGSVLLNGENYVILGGDTDKYYVIWNKDSNPTTFTGTDVWSETVGDSIHIIGYNDGGTWRGYFPNKPMPGQLVNPLSITADQIAANSIYAAALQANCITSDKILAGEIKAVNIEAATITANKYAELRNSMVFNDHESLDATHNWIQKFLIISEMTAINSVTLSIAIEEFRAYSTAASSGGGQTSSTGGGFTDESTSGASDWDPWSVTGGVTSGASASGTPSTTNTGSTKVGDFSGDTGSYEVGSSGDTDTYAIGSSGNTGSEDGADANTSYEESLATYTDYADGTGSHHHVQNEINYNGHRHDVTSISHSHTIANASHKHNITNADHKHSLANSDHVHTLNSHTHTTGDHTHDLDTWQSDHTHTITLSAHSHTVADHTHGVTYGIYEDSQTPTINYRISDGGTPGAWSGNITADQLEIDITSAITSVGWKYIEFKSDVRCRIKSIIVCKLDITA